MNLPVLMYHRIRPTGESPIRSDFIVDEAVLRRQLAWLSAHGFSTPTVADALDGRAGAKSVLLTFDDGYTDLWSTALPVLLEHGFRAITFVVTEPRRRLNFWDRMLPTTGAALVEPAHLRLLAHSGVEIGSHGVNHARLDTLDDASVRRELAESKEHLEDVLGDVVDTFAYPYGAVSPRVKELVREAGYRAAFAVHSGPFAFGEDPYEIRRIHVGNRADEPYLYAKLSGLHTVAQVSSSLVKWWLSSNVTRTS